jgi:alpha-galactosidase
VRPVSLRAGGAEVPFREGVVRAGDVELVVAGREQGSGLRIDWSVRNPGAHAVRLDEIGIGIDAAPELVLEHGWQSWSVVRVCRPGDVRPERRDVPEWRRAMYCSDVERAGRVVAGDQFLLTDAGIAGFLDGRRHLGLVEAAPVTAWALLDGVALAPGDERPLHPLWLAAGDPGALYSEYATLWGAETEARATTPAPAGWCSWYQYFSSVTPADVRANLPLAAAHGLEVVQIDDGYQSEIGDWLAPRPAWAEGVGALAGDIAGAGLRAGIWTAPFLAGENSRLLADHPDWVGRRAMHNPVWWGGWALALDTANPAVLDHITATMAALTAEGFDYHKVDFLYAGALPADRSCTRAETLRRGLEAVRLGVGDDAFLLGCGSPFGPAAGIVDAMRVSPDVTTAWEPRTPLPGLYEAASSAGNAIAASRLRAPLHRRLWVNDNDCLLLRPTQTELDAGRRRLLAGSVAGGGAFTVVSDDLSLYGDEEWALLEAVRTSPDEPLDLDDPFSVHFPS